ncbi:uncharacterized protein [Phyllobates terribilis]|uniref:uncharacterized protein n=1 Tax=Phyllobates terribilis TaxID=111132 RepID=UPI003CCA6FCE
MSHFGRAGPPDIRDTYSLLVLNITFRTTADDLHPLFDKYGKVVDVFIPRDRRTGESRGFAFVRYKYQDEAQKAVERLDGRVVDGREMMVQFAKYGPNAERISKGRVAESSFRSGKRSRSPGPRHSRESHREREYRRRSRSRSRDRYSRDRDYRRRSRSRSYSRSPARPKYDDRRSRSPYTSVSPRHRDSPSPKRRSPSSPTPKDISPRAVSRSQSPLKSDAADLMMRAVLVVGVVMVDDYEPVWNVLLACLLDAVAV